MSRVRFSNSWDPVPTPVRFSFRKETHHFHSGCLHTRALFSFPLTRPQVIADLNRNRMENRPFGIVTRLSDVSGSLEERNAYRRKELVDSWELLRSLIGERSGTHNVYEYWIDCPHHTVDKDGQFRKEAIVEGQFSRLVDTKDCKRKFLSGVCRFFEKQFASVMDEDIRARPRIANIGGTLLLSSALYIN